MAAGDVFATGGSAAAASNTYYQPAAGVEILITMFNCNKMNVATIWQSNQTTFNANIADWPSASVPLVFKLFINNSIHIGFYNASGSAAQWAITGMQLK